MMFRHDRYLNNEILSKIIIKVFFIFLIDKNENLYNKCSKKEGKIKKINKMPIKQAKNRKM